VAINPRRGWKRRPPGPTPGVRGVVVVGGGYESVPGATASGRGVGSVTLLPIRQLIVSS